jgi:hypothetical protein
VWLLSAEWIIAERPGGGGAEVSLVTGGGGGVLALTCHGVASSTHMVAWAAVADPVGRDLACI